MHLQLQSGDITHVRADAIVNAANNALLGGGGVDGAIHRAGGQEILEACRELRRTTLPDGLPTGKAVATTAGRLPARWVIHTVGPVYSAEEDRSAQLRSAYTESLSVARDLSAESVAFPLVSAGIFGWPKDDAIRQALRAIAEFEHTGPDPIRAVILVLFDPDTFELARTIQAAGEPS